MAMNPFKYKRGLKQGQGLVEFALALPILLVVMVGIMEVGRLLFIYTSVVNASREAVRFGSANGAASGVPQYYDCTGIENAAMQLGTISGFDATGITISYDNGNMPSPTTKYASCAILAGTPSNTIETGDRIVVTVTATYTPVLQYLGLEAIPSFPISSTSSRTIIGNIALEGMGSGVSGGSPPGRPDAPVYDHMDVGSSPGGKCRDLTIYWTEPASWSGLTKDYSRVRVLGYQWEPTSPPYISGTSYYNPGWSMNNGSEATFWVKTWFTSGPPSEAMKVKLQCNSGVVTVVP